MGPINITMIKSIYMIEIFSLAQQDNANFEFWHVNSNDKNARQKYFISSQNTQSQKNSSKRKTRKQNTAALYFSNVKFRVLNKWFKKVNNNTVQCLYVNCYMGNETITN